MQWYFWLWAAVILGLIIGYSVYYYFRHMRKRKPMHEQYIWLGEGEHPLKKTRKIKLR